MAILLLRLGRSLGFFALTLGLMPVQAGLALVKSRAARRLPMLYHRACCRLFGFEIETVGVPSSHRPTLFIANHISYLDIMVVSATIQASFVAKAEVARWPFFGWLARLQGTLFVDRGARRQAPAQRDSLHRRLAAGDNLVLFPEGTSGDGIHILPFKSALLAAAEDERVIVQPVSIAYLRLDGMPLGRFQRPLVAWYGDMKLVPHLWTVLGQGRVGVEVSFHTPVRFADFGSRKALADYCHAVVANGVSTALTGRREVAQPPAPLPAAAAAQ